MVVVAETANPETATGVAPILTVVTLTLHGETSATGAMRANRMGVVVTVMAAREEGVGIVIDEVDHQGAVLEVEIALVVVVVVSIGGTGGRQEVALEEEEGVGAAAADGKELGVVLWRDCVDFGLFVCRDRGNGRDRPRPY